MNLKEILNEGWNDHPNLQLDIALKHLNQALYVFDKKLGDKIKTKELKHFIEIVKSDYAIDEQKEKL